MSPKVSLCALLLSASFAVHAETRVHSVPSVQTMTLAEDFSDFSPGKVAIDGDFSIVIEPFLDGRAARLWHRDATGQWSRVAIPDLLHVDTTTPPQNDDLVMANGIAALRIGSRLHIFERSGSTYVESGMLGTPNGAPGMAISGRSILVARTGCNFNAALFEKDP